MELPAQLYDLGGVKPGTKQDWLLTFATEEEARGEIPLHVVKGLEPGPTLLILAAVHGNEYEGVQTVMELIHALQPGDIRGTALLVPFANKLAYEGVSRETPLDGRNLAREFPGDPNGAYTQRLAWHLDHTLIAHADFLLDYHSGGANFSIPLLIGYYHHDEDEAGRRSRAAAEAFGIETIWAHPEVGPGRTVSSATDRGIPWIYTEAFGGLRIRAEEQERYRLGAFRLMDHLGMLLQPERWIVGDCPRVRNRLLGDGNFDLSFCSNTAGFFIPAVQLLDDVQTGDRIGTIYGAFGEELQSIHTTAAGVVVGLAARPKINAGDSICAITRRFEAAKPQTGR
ncbi:succinylglutamate desuccinylase/aspartoacylase [Paenibacillus nasutitermitis]|uniref:Succinylglutamate desuccinylase/aspartoacylase n=2 Tax=Paenibacillus nasutitermitis TaxID=1652958 RepID=A0A916YLZ1_9BACL|nr:succinylglutamate desuccinylase/aspartoacylase [Paenibacillus nasutitermitis]